MEHKAAEATAAATSSWNRIAHSQHEATALLMLHALEGRVTHGAARWILVPPPPPSAAAAAAASSSPASPASLAPPTLSFVFTLVRSCGSAVLRLRLVPLFDSTLVRGSLHLRQSSEPLFSTSDLSAVEEALARNRANTKAIDLPSLTVPDVWPTSLRIPASGCSLASLPAELVAPAAASLHSLLFDAPLAPESSSESFWDRLESLRVRAQKARVEEELFSGFLGQVLVLDQASVSAAAAAADAQGPSETHLLRFPAERQVTQQSAFVTLLHLLLIYEGFRPAGMEEGAAATAASIAGECSTAASVSSGAAASTSTPSLAAVAAATGVSPAAAPVVPSSLFPPNWSSFSSSQSLSYVLAYKHLSLAGVLPRHEVRVKILNMAADCMILHAQFVTDTAPPPLPSPPTATEEEEQEQIQQEEKGQDVSMQTPSAPAAELAPIAPSKIYSITFRPSDFLQPALLRLSPLPLPNDPSQLFRNLGALLSQLRNRMLKHMLGEEYRRAIINNNAGAAASSAAAAASAEPFSSSAPCHLAQLPSELLLGILQLLPSSSDVMTVGHTCWALQYLSSHPFIWQQLCEREMPLPPPASAPAAGSGAAGAAAPSVVHKTDWKNEFRARKLGKEKEKVRSECRIEQDRRTRTHGARCSLRLCRCCSFAPVVPRGRSC